jgi:hypothetical protein
MTLQTKEDRDGGGFPGSVWAEQRKRLAARDFEIKLIKRDQ